MLKDIAEAMLGRHPFDLVIRNVQIVNVFSASIVSGSIGIVNGHIAGVFGPHLRNKHLMGGAQPLPDSALMAATLMPCLASWILTCIWRAAC